MCLTEYLESSECRHRWKLANKAYFSRPYLFKICKRSYCQGKLFPRLLSSAILASDLPPIKPSEWIGCCCLPLKINFLLSLVSLFVRWIFTLKPLNSKVKTPRLIKREINPETDSLSSSGACHILKKTKSSWFQRDLYEFDTR